MHDEPIVGVIDGGSRPDSVSLAVDAAEAAGARVVTGGTEMLETDVDVLVAPGDGALDELVRSPSVPDTPVLPVDLAPGIASVPAADLEAAIEETIDGECEQRSHVILSVTVDGQRTRAIRDVALVTDEPARISEFAVDASDTGRITRLRADGVVVATPAGSHGYAARADGPLLAPETGLAVVPIAPFVTDADRWVIPTGRVTCRICRNETPIAVEADGREVAIIDLDDRVEIDPNGTLQMLIVPSSRSPYER